MQLNLPVPLLEYEYSITTGSDGEPLLTLGFGSGFYLYFTPTTLNVSEQPLSTLQVYPNPTSDYFVINKSVPADAQITLFSMSGQIQKLDYKTNGVYNVSFLSSGVYFLTITTSEWRKQVKLVKN